MIGSSLIWARLTLNNNTTPPPSPQSLLGRLEETLAGGAPEDNTLVEQEEEQEYDGADQGPDRPPVGPERPAAGPAAGGYGRPATQRSRLQDLLMATRSRTSSCFGSRMDRVGNSSGLGCNTGRGNARSGTWGPD